MVVSLDTMSDLSDTESEKANEYVVEAILKKRTIGKRVEYFIKWKGIHFHKN